MARINSLRRDFGRAGKAVRAENIGVGTVIGQVPEHPFMGPAMDRTSPEMQEIFIREVERGTARAIKRIAKQAHSA